MVQTRPVGPELCTTARIVAAGGRRLKLCIEAQADRHIFFKAQFNKKRNKSDNNENLAYQVGVDGAWYTTGTCLSSLPSP